MEELQIKVICPLGSKCEVAKDGLIERCAWYTKVRGKNPQSEEFIDTWNCALAWLPIMLVEVAQTNRGQTAAIESFRNNMAEGMNTFLQIAMAGQQSRLIRGGKE